MNLQKESIIFGTIEQLTEYIYNNFIVSNDYTKAQEKMYSLFCTKQGIKNQLMFLKENNLPVKINSVYNASQLIYGPILFHQSKKVNNEIETTVMGQYVCITA